VETVPAIALWEGPVRSAENVARDEELLRQGGPTVRVAVIADRSVSVGVGQREEHPVFARAEQQGLPVVRRSTGGTGVLHLPGDLVWSVVLPRTHVLVGDDFTCAYPRLGAGVVEFLRRQGVGGSWSPPFGLSEEFCLLGPRGQVLAVERRALGGAAQHLTRHSLLHQGMVAQTIDRSLLGSLFNISHELLEQRATALVELVGERDPAILAAGLLEAMEGVLRASPPSRAT
jgi:lipoate-protein ligase A